MKTIHLKLDEKVFIVVPNAPIEDQKRSWYPLPQKNSDDELVEDCEGLMKAINPLRELLHNMVYASLETSDKKFFLVSGFSQGAALSLACYATQILSLMVAFLYLDICHVQNFFVLKLKWIMKNFISLMEQKMML